MRTGSGLLGGLSGRGLGGGLLGAGQELSLPLGQWLGLGGDVDLLAGATQAGGAVQKTLRGGVGNNARQQRYGPDGVVIAGNAVGDLIGVAVGVKDRNNGDIELPGLGNGQVLLLGCNLR